MEMTALHWVTKRRVGGKIDTPYLLQKDQNGKQFLVIFCLGLEFVM